MKKFLLGILLLLCIPFSLSALPANGTVYLSTSGNDANNGTSWASAVKSITRALELAQPAKKDVWIAGGSYAAVNLSSNFEIYDGVGFYGGFKGNDAAETVASRQKPAGGKAWEFTNPTVWQGDKTNPLFAMAADNATAPIVFDGITFKDGASSTNGVMVIAFKGKVTLRNSIFRDNTTTFTVAGYQVIQYWASSAAGQELRIEGCYFFNNSGAIGGALQVTGASGNTNSTYIDNCLFEKNISRGGNNCPGGITYNGTVLNTLSNTSFIENGSEAYGTVLVTKVAKATISNCLFSGNTGRYCAGVGAIMSATATVSGCTFKNNTSKDSGTAICGMAGNLTVVNSVISNNSNTTAGGDIVSISGGSGSIINTTITNNTGNVNVPGNIYNSVVWGNRASDGTSVSFAGDPLVSNSAFDVDLSQASKDKGSVNNIFTQNSAENVFGLKRPTSFWGFADTDEKLAELNAADWSLSPYSKVINAGSNGWFPSDIAQKDISGSARIQLGTIDMGAYESATKSVQTIVYVKPDGNDLCDGSNWTFAKKTPLSALNYAKSGGVKTIYMAGGSYPVVNITQNFENYDGISIYGSFAGVSVSETPATRQKPAGGKAWEFTNPTVWQGDKTNPFFAMAADNTTAPIVFDGITFKDGASEPNGMAAILFKGKVTLRNSIFRDNISTSTKTLTQVIMFNPVSLTGPELRVEGCYFFNNSGTYGGALGTTGNTYSAYNTYIDSCLFEKNRATAATAANGGGVTYSSNINGMNYISNTSFIDNNALNVGTVVARISKMAITNCLFSGNTAKSGAGVGVSAGNAEATISGCTFKNNTATSSAVIWSYSGTVKVVNSVISNNHCTTAGKNVLELEAGSIINSTITNNTGTVNMSGNAYNCVVWGNRASDGTPVSFTGDPLVSNSAFDVDLSQASKDKGSVNNIFTQNSAENVFGLKRPTSFWGVADTDEKLEELNVADWSLSPYSKVINAGANGLFPSDIAQTDISGSARIQLGTIDMGAYESATKSVQTIVYVKPDGNDLCDGSNWTFAKKTPLSALNYAKAGGVKTIYMAGGSYPVVNITQNFENYDGISIYGGFAGADEGETPATRQKPSGGKAWEFSNPTVWQGDKTNPLFAMTADNTTAPIVFDGITFKDGASATDNCAILFKGKVTLRNSIFRDNVSTSTKSLTQVIMFSPVGATDPELRVEGCYFFNNSGNYGGALGATGNASSSAYNTYIDNCLFEKNRATGASAANGAGITYGNNSKGMNYISNTSFIDNSALNAGTVAARNSKTVITNCLFWGNTARYGAGVGVSIGAAEATISGCTFKNNTTTTSAVIWSSVGTVKVVNSVISNNHCTTDGKNVVELEAGSIINSTITNNTGTVNMSGNAYNCVVWGNRASDGTPVSFTGDPLVSNSAFDVDLSEASMAKGSADNVVITGNDGNIFGFRTPTSFYGIADTEEKLAELNAADWTVRSNSVIINKGKNEWFPDAVTSKDIAGNNRVFAGVIDPGAYESLYTPEPVPVAPDLSDLHESSVIELDKGAGEYTCGGQKEFKGVTFKADPENDSQEIKLQTGSSITVTEDLSLDYDLTGHTDKWIFLSLPFDMDVTDGVHMVDGPAERVGKGEVDFGLRVYDSKNRATGSLSNWWNINHSGNPGKGAHTAFPDGTTVLKAGQGFIFYLPSSAVKERSVRFYANGQATLRCTVDLSVDYYLQIGKPYDAGWQLIGLPLTSRSADMSGQTEAGGIPSFVYQHNGSAYIANPTSEFQMKPFVGYFMQVADTTKDWRFSSSADQTRSLRSVQSKDTETVRKASLSMVQAGKEVDRTTVVFDNNASKNYVYNEDALKLVYGSENRIYTICGGQQLSYNRMPEAEGASQTVQMKSVVKAGTECRIAPIANAQGFSAVMIQNTKGGDAKDLMKEEFALQSGEQTYTLTFVNIPTGVDTPQAEGVYAFFKDGKLYVTGINGHCRLYNCSGSMVWEGLIEEQPDLALPNGIYILGTERGNIKISK